MSIIGQPSGGGITGSSSTVYLTQLDTQQKTNKLLVLNNAGAYELQPFDGLTINIDQIQPSDTQYDVLTTDASYQLAWSKLSGTSINSGSIDESKIISLPTSKLTGTVSNAQIGGSITEDKLVSLPTSKLTGTVSNA